MTSISIFLLLLVLVLVGNGAAFLIASIGAELVSIEEFGAVVVSAVVGMLFVGKTKEKVLPLPNSLSN